MNIYPNRDCAHLRGEYTPIIVDNEITGAKLTGWCCDLSGCQSCGTDECPTDRRYDDEFKYRGRQNGQFS